MLIRQGNVSSEIETQAEAMQPIEIQSYIKVVYDNIC